MPEASRQHDIQQSDTTSSPHTESGVFPRAQNLERAVEKPSTVDFIVKSARKLLGIPSEDETRQLESTKDLCQKIRNQIQTKKGHAEDVITNKFTLFFNLNQLSLTMENIFGHDVDLWHEYQTYLQHIANQDEKIYPDATEVEALENAVQETHQYNLSHQDCRAILTKFFKAYTQEKKTS